MAATPTPFTLAIPQADLDDLMDRLSRTRFPDRTPGEAWAYGTDPDYLRELVAYWRDGFDWRREEAALNAFPQFRVELDGIPLHYMKVEGTGPDPIPLLLLHGWPGSVLEFLELIPLLTDPASHGVPDAPSFTVIAPSLPGFTLSFAPDQKRFSCEEMAATLAKLMDEVLGIERYMVQGGDWGAFVGSRLAFDHPDRVRALHLNFLPLRRDAAVAEDPSPEEQRYLEELAEFLREETGYQVIQGTRPQTLASALADSPAGLAAWIVEKFHVWTDNDGRIENAVSRDRMLADISLYWFTGAIGSSFWPYYARAHGPWPIPLGGTIAVPVGYLQSPREILRPPRTAAARVYTDIRRWESLEKGGHFAALENPDALAGEIRALASSL
ncbi:epoxide hydrolase family protein [Thalassobaculum litoreum]|uniref:Epoxide hydrolase n=1 Tax=Thalassobaculum litoreum DSM 18839 TaxID=1123362 RepID=A0A8G2EVR7_9PROT|nr:epoxide hydrolase family protein [Thalassobaculum litoreum]SDF42155.1 epoxide hydrolase [Thalassobaculum litoreum DSM 18839]